MREVRGSVMYRKMHTWIASASAGNLARVLSCPVKQALGIEYRELPAGQAQSKSVGAGVGVSVGIGVGVSVGGSVGGADANMQEEAEVSNGRQFRTLNSQAHQVSLGMPDEHGTGKLVSSRKGFESWNCLEPSPPIHFGLQEMT